MFANQASKEHEQIVQSFSLFWVLEERKVNRYFVRTER